MKQLTCEMCGSTDLVKQDGVFVCQTCGCKYSIEEAKKMMIEGTVDVSGSTVKVDSTSSVESYLTMAKNAHEGKNNAEAEVYCNKTIELDPTNYEAWFLKGQSVGWQSTLRKPRVVEGITAFTKAIACAPADQRDDYVSAASSEIQNLICAFLSLRQDHFSEFPSAEGKNEFLGDVTSSLNALKQFVDTTGADISFPEIIKICSLYMALASLAGRNTALRDTHPGDYDYHLSDREWEHFVERMDACIELAEQSAEICPERDDIIDLYDRLIMYQEDVISSHSWAYQYAPMLKDYTWCVSKRLSSIQERIRKQKIEEYKGKINGIKNQRALKEAEEAKKRTATYWAEHADEKASLEAERESLVNQVIDLKNSVRDIPGTKEKDALIEQINTLTSEKNVLGFFKVKEKRALQEKIDAYNQNLNNLLVKIDDTKAKLDAQISAIESRINDITSELTKNR